MRGGKEIAELSEIPVPSTLTGKNGAAAGAAIFVRPDGDSGNDSALLAESLAMARGEGDRGCKGPSNG